MALFDFLHSKQYFYSIPQHHSIVVGDLFEFHDKKLKNMNNDFGWKTDTFSQGAY